MTATFSRYIGRFAPSPTGDLHFGSLLVAVGSWLRARANLGHWLIRIEDLDRARTVPGAGDRIVRTLGAYSLVSDQPVLNQHADTSRYATALESLIKSGAAYPCRCSRSDLLAAGTVHRACVATAPHSPSETESWRFKVPAGEVTFLDELHGVQTQDVERDVGDFLLRRANGEFTYQLAVVVDDALQGVSEVVRGGDLIESTARQILLQRSLGLETPGYLHLPMVLDDSGAKLSKRVGNAPVDADDPMASLRAVLQSLGQFNDPAAQTPRDLLEAATARFELAALPRAQTLPSPRY